MERLRQVDQEILEAEKKSRKMDQATKDVLAKTAKIEDEIVVARERMDTLTNERFRRYLSTLDQMTKDMFADTAVIEEEIEATIKKRYMLEKINEGHQRYSSTLDRAIDVALVRTAEVDKEIKAAEEKINKINMMIDRVGKMVAEQDQTCSTSEIRKGFGEKPEFYKWEEYWRIS